VLTVGLEGGSRVVLRYRRGGFLFRKKSGIECLEVDPNEPALLVIAKQPIPGRVKTRLTPPCTPEQAAALAEAALLDTLATVAATPASRRVLVFEGDPCEWQPAGFDVIAQRGDGLGARLAAAFEDVTGPALLVGMDTPQLTPAQLSAAARQLRRPGVDAVIAPTFDGGYWCVGFNAAVPGAFDGVPMSTEQTYVRQRQRFNALGLTVAIELPLRDVDTFADAHAVAEETVGSRFAAAYGALEHAGIGLAA
jgi:rSAM/selenodomain-associated transferase 1